MFSDTSLDSINKMFSNQKNVIITEGEFPKTSNIIQEKYFSFVHIDVDIYKSIMECCLFFYNRMNVGGILLFDDYGDLSCPGAKEAVDEFFSDKLENPIYLPTGQSFIIKVKYFYYITISITSSSTISTSIIPAFFYNFI